jgi:hypothetical protein
MSRLKEINKYGNKCLQTENNKQRKKRDSQLLLIEEETFKDFDHPKENN